MAFKDFLFVFIVQCLINNNNCIPENIAVFEGSSNFTQFCADSFNIIGNYYGMDESSGKLLYIADKNGILPNETDRYRMEPYERGRKIIYTKNTTAYSDNFYHDCVREFPLGPAGTLTIRGVIVVLCMYYQDNPI